MKDRVEFATKTDINELKHEFGLMKRDIHWLKWTIGVIGGMLVGGIGAMLSIILYLHKDTKETIKHSIKGVKSKIKAELLIEGK